MVDIVASIILSILVLEPNHYLNKEENISLLRGMSLTYIAMEAQYNIDPIFLIVNNFFESDFKPDVVGKAGEVGIAQVHGRAKAICLEKYDPYSHIGGIKCSALLFSRGIKQCGSLEASLRLYLSGRCNPKTERPYKRARMRMSYYRYIKKRYRKEMAKHGLLFE